MFHADIADVPVIRRLAAAEPCAWINPKRTDAETALEVLSVSRADVRDASARLRRFAPYIVKRFPETRMTGGLIESPLQEIPHLKEALGISGRLFAKLDSELPIAGSIKARGGIYEVLKYAETLALKNGLLKEDGDYAILNSEKARAFFSNYTVQVGSTGNLGLSIGIMSASLGFFVTVHMSADARQWKKDLLREKGVDVVEYSGDYSAAVAAGRRQSDADPASHFVDDEHSVDLFLGYAVAAERIQKQLADAHISVDANHPLFVYIPCGVGGGPGGITVGLKQIYGDDVHVFFTEPVQAPCMLLGLATGLHEAISVSDIGLTGKTHADGLAVGRPSGFAGRAVEKLLSGAFTLSDARLYDDLRLLENAEGIFAEPSACAAFSGPTGLLRSAEGQAYIEANALAMKDVVHIAWLTGGALVPEATRDAYREMRL